MNEIQFTDKQKEVWRNTIEASHRWNISTGATRSGKTYLDYYKIAYRVRNASPDGLILLLGNTQGTLERNILEPMRAIWTEALVGNIVRGDNTVTLFGRKCYALGADKISQVHKLQGAGLSYAYGDEITTWNQEVFAMLQSRLDKKGACFDGTCNPEGPSHWFKSFLDSDTDIYQMAFEIDDNTFLDPSFVANLKREYAGTVYWDRWIKGRWKAAEGLIYRQFADKPEDYTVEPKDIKDIEFLTIGIDFGGNRSLTTFVASAVHYGFKGVTVVADWNIKGKKGDINAEVVSREFIGFYQRLKREFPNKSILYVFADNEAQYIINSMNRELANAGISLRLRDSAKKRITDRIICGNTLLNTGKLKISSSCTLLPEGLKNAVWDKKAADKGEDKRLDNFSSDIDILDAFEYSWERFMRKLLPGFKERKD